jgi:[glutamine synthetase] adenylyltransferase / [glutamine synthetase]-adenylyl-L-tyrosine phosphorylase
MSAPELPLDLFHDARSGERNLRSMHELFLSSGSRASHEDFSRAILTILHSSPDPDLGLTNLLRFCEVSTSKAGLFTDLVQYPVLLDMLMRILGNSRFFADILVREPELFRWLTASSVLNAPLTAVDLADETGRISGMFSTVERRMDALRRLFRRQLLRIGARDVLGLADLVAVTTELSLLADGIIGATVGWTWEQLRSRAEGVPDLPFAVIGLGKLGGGELNYSSDIDLLFIYGDPAPDADAEAIHAFFHAFGERLVQHLSRSTGEGHLFRVDMRLRPESGAGPLARSLQSYLLYYESRGELWERQMLIKARFVGGDRALGAAFLQALEPFVYPRAFLEHPAEAIVRMKARIESTLGEATNIKLMPGGIRDIEFIAQALQLLHAGRNTVLRGGNTLVALAALGRDGTLPSRDARGLARAYTFYRTIEHRLQIMQNTQTHIVPSDERERGLLARRIGLSSASILNQEMRDHLRHVRGVFTKVLQVRSEPTSAGLEAAIDGVLTEDATQRILVDLGFRDVRQALRNMRSLAFGSTLTGTREVDSRARTAFRQVATILFNDIAATPDPDLTLHSVTLIGGAQRFPGSFFAQMQDPRFRRFLVDTCATSPRFARVLGDHPALLESLATDPAGRDLAPGDGLPATDDLVTFKLFQEVRAGVRHILGFSRFEELTVDLSTVAEFIVTRIIDGQSNEHGRKPRLAVFALGKLGSRELTFDADLDLLFVGEAASAEVLSDLERIAGACVRELTAISDRGRLYDVDLRLRPEGRNAPLVPELSAYRSYLANRASLWERQSLTRLRWIGGDEELGQRVLRNVQDHVFNAALPSGWVATTVDMRKKMESRTRTRGEAIVDIKLGAGAMVDIEFLVQMLQMAGAVPPEVRGRDVFTVLRATSAPLVTDSERERLTEAYALFRRLELFIRVTLGEHGSILPVQARLDTLARCAVHATGAELLTRVQSTMTGVRVLFLEIAERISRSATPS